MEVNQAHLTASRDNLVGGKRGLGKAKADPGGPDE